MPTTAGILAIIGGFFTVGWLLGIYSLLLAFSVLGDELFNPFGYGPLGAVVVLVVAAIPVLAIIGGISAIKRKRWGLALAGSIAACIPTWFIGLPAVIFTVLSAGEFE